MTIREQIAQYRPFNEQEARDQELMLWYMHAMPDVFLRENRVAHMTASAWVVNPSRDKALMAYHRIYDAWSWLGGHADGDEDLLGVALREVREESGLKEVRPVTPGLFSLEALTVDGHEKRGRYVSSHLHLNVTYLMEADDAQPLRIRPEENSGVAWFALEQAVAASRETWFRERVYAKLNQKLRQTVR